MARGKADGYIYVDTKVDGSGFSKGVGRMKKAGVAAAAMIGAAVIAAGAAFIGLSLKAEKAVTAENRIRNIAENMGYLGDEADTVTKRLVEYAEATARATGIDANSIKATQAKLATFSELAATMDETGGAFDRATQAAIDMAAAGFGDAESNAVQLGKALQDPIKGITALNRSGVTFTEQQKEMIQAMVESGDTLGAQNLILQELEKQVGGSAEATADASAKMRASWDLAQERLGKKLLPTFEKLTDWVIDEGIPAFESLVDYLQGLDFSPLVNAFNAIKDAVVPVAEAVIGFDYGGAWDTLAGIVDSLQQSFSWLGEVFADTGSQIKDSLGPAIDSLKLAWESLRPALEYAAMVIGGILAIALGLIIGVINGVARAIAPLIRAIGGIVTIVMSTFNLIKAIFTGDGEKIKEAIAAIGQGIVDVFAGLYGAVAGLLTGFVEGVVAFFSGLYKTLVGASIVPDMIRAIVAWFAKLPAQVGAAVKQLVTAVIGWFTDMASAAVARVATLVTDAVKLVKSLPDKFRAALGTLSSVGRDLVVGLWNGINDKFSWLVGKIRTFASNVTDKLKGFFGIKSPSKLFEREIGVNLALGVGKGFSSSMQDVTRRMASTVNSEVGRLSAGLSLTGGVSYGGLTVHVDARGSEDPAAVEAAGNRGVFAALEEAVRMGRLREGLMTS